MKTNKDIPYRRFTRKIIKHVYFFLIHSWLSSIQSLSNKAKVVSNVLSPCQMNVLLLWWLFLFFWNKRILFFHIVHVRHHYKPIICSILNMNNKKKMKTKQKCQWLKWLFVLDYTIFILVSSDHDTSIFSSFCYLYAISRKWWWFVVVADIGFKFDIK